ncbi:MAG: class II aldolase/adducin family protein [Bryobacteraceae bacterium]|nr:class II aldolase/adducin family protein [Bryobacteraceae bacterium]
MTDPLQHLCDIARSFFERGLAFGSTGNLSFRSGGDIWITPTGKSFRALSPDELALIDLDGNARNSNKPSKEYPFHLGCYRNAGERANAIVHLHSTYSVALSCLERLDPAEPIPVITPYYLMRVAPLAIVPYHRPGSQALGDAVAEAAKGHDCLLLRNHGLIALGRTMDEAVDRAEELEETAKLHLLLRGEETRKLTPPEREEIWNHYRK